MIDPAVIAAVAASAANQRRSRDTPATASGLLFSAVVVFGIAGLIVWACQFFCCGT